MGTDRKEIFKNRFQEHYPRLCNIAYGYVLNRDDSEDIVQELFINIWNKGKDDLSDKEFLAYMITSVRNSCISFLRKKQEDIIPLEDHHIENCDEMDEIKDGEEEEMSLHDHLHAALATLPEKCREVFLMAKMRGMKYREIAGELDLSEKTVENHIAKAIKLLRAYAAEHRFVVFALLTTVLSFILKK